MVNSPLVVSSTEKCFSLDHAFEKTSESKGYKQLILRFFELYQTLCEKVLKVYESLAQSKKTL